MFLLKLFHQSDPEHPIAAHMAVPGRTRVGRDPEVEWVVSDPEREVSRTHFELACAGKTLTLTPLGTNGVFTEGGARLADGEALALAPGDAVSFGKYRMIVEAPRDDAAPLSGDRTIVAAPFGTNLDIPAAWPDPDLASVGESGDSLLDAFCRGADLDVSAFSGEDPLDVLERAGKIYRQTVLGLADLMQARSSIKNDHRLERTTIGAEDNNPFKWAPSRRLASDLLLGGGAGFQSGPAAIRASLGDIKKHMLGTLAGFHAALGAVLDAARPDRIEARVKAQKSLLQSQAAACWAELGRIHAELDRECAEGISGPIGDAFVAAYESRLSELDQAPDAKLN